MEFSGSFFPGRRVAALCVALFCATALLVYGESLRNSFVTLDDNYLIYENPIITRITPGTLRHIFTTYDPELYDPLTFVTYQIDYRIAGLEPWAYHAQNLLWHTLNALLVAWLLFALSGNAIISIALGLLFLVHPMNTEAVAWAAARKDVLSTFFFLSSVLSYLCYRETDSGGAYRMSIGFFLLGLLSKVLVVTLPVILILIDWLEGRRLGRKALIEKIPYVLLSCIFGVVALFGKTNALLVTSVPQKMLMAFKTTWFTLETFFVPVRLSLLYPYSGTVTLASVDFLLPILGILTLGILASLAVRRTKIPAFGLAFFVVTLSPAFINFAKGNELFAGSDRYGYIPMIGLLSILAAGFARLVGYDRTKTIAVQAGMILVLVAAGAASFTQAKNWADSETLYTSVLENYPLSLTARNNLGMVYLVQGKTDEALAQFNLLLEKSVWPIALVNRGLTYYRQGNIPAAVADYTRAKELDPSLDDAYYELGNVAYSQGKLEEAAGLYTKAVELNPQFANAVNNLGATQLRLHRLDDAAATFRTLLTLNPLFTEAYYNLAVIYEQTGKFMDAADMYRQALSLNPGDADAAAGLARVKGRL